jgi:hypothetical protein
MAKSAPKPGTRAHENAVKKVLRNQAKGLDALQVIEAKNLKIGNSFVSFRFRSAATPGKVR